SSRGSPQTGHFAGSPLASGIESDRVPGGGDGVEPGGVEPGDGCCSTIVSSLGPTAGPWPHRGGILGADRRSVADSGVTDLNFWWVLAGHRAQIESLDRHDGDARQRGIFLDLTVPETEPGLLLDPPEPEYDRDPA